MANTAIWPDLEKWLCGWLRDRLAERDRDDVYVDRKDPGRDVTEPYFVAVRYDGGFQDSVITEDSSLGVRVGGPGSDVECEDTGDLARLVRALITACPSADSSNPVAAVTQMNGPFVIEPADRPLMYLTCTLRTVGSSFNL